MNKYKEIARNLALPLGFLLAFSLLGILWVLLDIPKGEELISIARSYFDEYGLYTVFLSALVEGLLFVGIYFPGSVVICLGVLFAGKDVSRVSEVVVLATFGLVISNSLNFFAGKYGWYRLVVRFGFKEPLQQAQKKLSKYGMPAMFFSYMHPNLSAITATAAGILHINFLKYLAAATVFTFIWDVMWASIAYFVGYSVVGFIGIRYAIAAIIVWIIGKLVLDLFRKKYPQGENVGL